MATIAVVIVNWNTGDLLVACLRALAKVSDRSLVREVFVVDNASGDDSVARAREVVGDLPVTFIESEANLGFAAANNVAIRRLQAAEGVLPHVLLLNPDTEVRDGALTALLDGLRQHERVGVVGCHLVNADGSTQASVRGLPTLAVLVVLFLKLARWWPKQGFWGTYLAEGFNYTKDEAVAQVMGAAFLIRNTVLEEVGLLDEGYFVWFEEVDYCAQAAAAGWDVWYTPAGEVMHHGGASFDQLIGWQRTGPFVRSALRYARKHLGLAGTVILGILSPVAAGLSIPASLGHLWLKRRTAAR